MKNYIIYLITNKINNKLYVGRTSDPLKKRWSVHKSHCKYHEKYNKKIGNSYLHRSMRKYGIDNFEIKQIDMAKDFNHMVWLEGFYIKYYNSNNSKYGYNLIIDTYGDGLEFISEYTKDKMSIKAHLSKNKPIGVTWDKNRNKWAVRIKCLNKKINKRFSKEEEAKIFVDKINLYLYKDNTNLYYPEKIEQYKKDNLEKFYDDFVNNKLKSKSQYKGVKFISNQYMVRMMINKNKRMYLGMYKDEIEAALIYDKVAIYIGKSFKDINFPEKVNDNYKNEGKVIYDLYSNRDRKRSVYKTNLSSKYLGVSKHMQSNIWCWEFTYKTIKYRGTTKTEIEAAEKRDIQSIKLLGAKAKTNFPISNYPVALEEYNNLNKIT